MSDYQISKSIRERMREARRIKGWSQERLAEAFEVSPQAIQNWEAGKRQMTIAIIRRLARVLAVEYAWLLGVEPPNLRRGEDELLQLWRRLSDEQRLALKVLLKSLGRS